LHASYAKAERRVIAERRDDKAMNLKIGRALSLAGRWVSEHIERFPIPVEDAMWVELTGHSVATDGTLERRIGRPPSR
jgi:hypothetical protein